MKLNIQLFAVTKSTTFSEPELTSEMISGNYSTLKITIKFSPNNTQTFFSNKTLKCTCDGETQSKSVSLSTGGSVTKTFTFTNIAHDDDGTKTVSWSWSIATGTSVLGTLKDSGTRTLQTIPRASELSVPSGTHYFGPNIDVTVKSQTFTKNIVTYSVFGQQIGSVDFGYFLPNASKTRSIYFPTNLITNIPDSASATARITCKTIYGVEASPLPETEIGTSTLDIPLQVPLDTKPSATIGTLAEANSTMRSLNWGIYVQNKSQLSIPITANGILGSKIKSIKVTTNGKSQTYKPTTLATTISYTFTTDTLTTSGSNTINVEVTDTRERVGTTSTTYTVQAYSKPKIETTTKAERVDADSDNSYLKYTFVASVTNVGGNASATTYKIGYKLRSDSTYTYISSATFTGTSTLNKTNQTISTPLFSKNNTYDIDFYVKDAFSDSETHVYKELEAEGDLMNFNASGKAMAIGKVSEAGSNEELLEIALPTYATEKIETNKCFKIPKNGSQGYGLCNSAGVSIIRNWSNNDVAVDATGNGLYLGYANTTLINFLNGKATIDSNGVYNGTASRSYNADSLRKLADVSSGNTANRPWHLIMRTNSLSASWRDTEAIILIRSYYQNGPTGILKVALRGNNTSNPGASIQWLVRYGFGINDVCLGLYNGSGGSNYYADVYVKRGTYARCEVVALRYDGQWQFVNSSEGDNGSSYSNVYASVGTTGMNRNYSSIIYPQDFNIVSLYDNSTGTNGNVTLSETSANFSYIDIQFRSSEGNDYVGCQRVYNPNGKYASLMYAYAGNDNGTVYFKMRNIYINGNSITTAATNRYSEVKLTSSTSASKVNQIYITKVMGYR